MTVERSQALVYFIVFVCSTTLHEAAHAWAALRGGDRTATDGGQVSLDPLPHMRREPFGMVVLPLLSALLAAIALRAGEMTGVLFAPETVRFGDLAGSDAGATWFAVGRFLSVVFSMNLLLMLFNLPPFPPLDGNAAITLFMDRGTTSRYREFIWSTPAIGFLGIFVAWQLFDIAFNPMFFFAVNLIHAGASYG